MLMLMMLTLMMMMLLMLMLMWWCWCWCWWCCCCCWWCCWCWCRRRRWCWCWCWCCDGPLTFSANTSSPVLAATRDRVDLGIPFSLSVQYFVNKLVLLEDLNDRAWRSLFSWISQLRVFTLPSHGDCSGAVVAISAFLTISIGSSPRIAGNQNLVCRFQSDKNAGETQSEQSTLLFQWVCLYRWVASSCGDGGVIWSCRSYGRCHVISPEWKRN